RADQALQGSITYATDLFDAARINRMVCHLRTLLRSLLDSADAAIGRLNLLPDAERLLIESWQRGADMATAEIGVHALFEQQARRTPEAIALVFEDQRISYDQLSARSTALAHHLIQLGVRNQAIVAVSLNRSPALVVALLSILKAGAAFLTIDPDLPTHRYQQLLSASHASVLLSQADQPEQLPTDCKHVDLRQQHYWDIPKVKPEMHAQSLDDLAYLLYTSGSTGTPKAVAIDHRSLLHRSLSLAETFGLNENARILALTAPVFDISIFELLVPLIRGSLICLASEEERRDPGQVARLIQANNINLLQGTPSYLNTLFTSRFTAQPGLRILAGGEAVPPPLAQRLIQAGAELWNGYGPTEATIYTTIAQLEADQPVHLGRPLPNVIVQILDPAGQTCPIGIPGELHIGGIGLARGYLNNPELTAEKFTADVRSCDPAARLYQSGDLASWNADGTLAYHGRSDQQIKLRGVRIEPGEIEAQLLHHPAVAQAVVLLNRDDAAHPRLVAYWVAIAASSAGDQPPAATEPAGPSRLDGPVRPAVAVPDAGHLRSFLRERLPDSMVPAAFVQLQSLPLTTTGKLDRKALPAPSFAGDFAQRIAPATPTERQLHALWAEVLGHSDFGVDDNFFLVGGHSLSATQLVAAIDTRLGLAMPVAALFRHPSIREQATELQARGDLPVAGVEGRVPASWTKTLPNLVTCQPRGASPPLFVVHGWGGTLDVFIHLARALAPHRPMMGLQASNAGEAEPELPAVRAMAADYAEQILQRQPRGPIHLLGYSGGGWYAHAVALELQA
ncbi:MAG: non-ribosomal peptide synthetase, partial [Cyanobium sp.]